MGGEEMNIWQTILLIYPYLFAAVCIAVLWVGVKQIKALLK